MKKLLLLIFIVNFTLIITAQTLQSVSPNSGERGTSNLSLMITGSGTAFQQATATTLFFTRGSTTLYGYNISVANNQTINADIDIPGSAKLGLYDLYVVDGFNYPVLPNAFSVLAGATATITFIPDTVCAGNTLEIAITGQNTNFTQGSGTYFYLESGNGSTLSSASQDISTSTSASAFFNFNGVAQGNYELIVYDPIDDSIFSTDSLFVHGPQIVSVDTDQSLRGVTLNVTINALCSNFQSGTTPTVWFQQNTTNVSANSVTVINDLQLIANITLSNVIPLGYYDVYVSDPIDHQFFKAQGFLVIDTPSGIQSINAGGIKIFPNPTTGSLFIESADILPSMVSLIDMNGKIVYSKNPASQNEELLIGNLSAGLYILSLTDKKGNSYYRKVVVQ